MQSETYQHSAGWGFRLLDGGVVVHDQPLTPDGQPMTQAQAQDAAQNALQPPSLTPEQQAAEDARVANLARRRALAQRAKDCAENLRDLAPFYQSNTYTSMTSTKKAEVTAYRDALETLMVGIKQKTITDPAVALAQLPVAPTAVDNWFTRLRWADKALARLEDL